MNKRISHQRPKYAPPRSELQYEALETLGYAPSWVERLTLKCAVEERDISHFEFFHPLGTSELRIPAWIKSGWSAMYSKGIPCRAYIEGADHANAVVVVYPDGKHTLGRVLWVYESLLHCARFWRWKEGLAIRDRAGRPIWPVIDADGFPIVDEWEREDGGKSILRAVDLPLTVCSYEEVRDFSRAAGLAPQYAFTRWKWRNSFAPFGGRLGIYVTGEPQLEQIDLPAPSHGRAPDASHGSAQWADSGRASAWTIDRG